MRVLAIDTATRYGSIAWSDGDRIDGALLGDGSGPPRHERLGPAARARMGGQTPEAFALAIGPGSFTGLRIGLSFVKGYAIARPAPVVAISTLEAYAAASGAPALAAIDARNGEVFARLDGVIAEGLYRTRELLRALESVPPGVIVGEPPPELAPPGWTIAHATRPLAETLIALARPRLLRGEGVDPMDLEPTYLQLAAVDRR